MRKLLYSVRWRLIFIYVLITIAVFCIISMLMTSIIESELLSERVSERINEVVDISVSAAPGLSGKDANSLYSLATSAGRELSGRVLIVDSAGVVQIDSFSMLNGTQLLGREIIEVLTGEKDTAFGYHKISPQKGESIWAVYYTSVIVDGSRTIGAVLLSQSIQDVVDNVNILRLQFVYVFAISVIGIFILSYLSTNHISRPIEDLTEGAISIAGGKLSTRVKTHGSNEISELGRVFNVMADQLENVDKQRSEFVSNASHELKTPLTSMKILAESLLYQDGIEESVYKEFLSDIDMEIDRLTMLINDLLMLTKLENKETAIKLQPTDICELAELTVKMLMPIAEQKKIELCFKAPSSVVADCEPVSFRQALNNLVDNAIKYSREGDSVTVLVFSAAGMCYVSVRDTGEGIPEEDVDRIFDRFYRVDKARARMTGGNGLGLYIVKRIVNNHNGRINVKSTVGEGSRFTIAIPLKSRSEKQDLTQEDMNE